MVFVLTKSGDSVSLGARRDKLTLQLKGHLAYYNYHDHSENAC